MMVRQAHHEGGLHWTHRVVGLPYRDLGRDRDGVDCWGLMVLAAREGGMAFPSYAGDYASPDEYREISTVVAREASSPLWQPVELKDVREFDVLVFRRARWDRHTAMFVRLGVMLHIEGPGTKSGFADYRHPDWRDLLTGVYRFQGARA